MSEPVGDPRAARCGCCRPTPRPRVRLDRVSVSGRTELLLCIICDMGGNALTSAQSGPPVLVDYIRKGHQ